MKTDEKGCSTCQPGEERFEAFYPTTARRGFVPTVHVQFDYRTPDGRLFSCIGRTLEECREKRDRWLAAGQAAAGRRWGR